EGFFIMHPISNDERKRNHHFFSPCTIRNISRNLHRLLAIKPKKKPNIGDRQTNCFIEYDTPFCGNGIREEDEECDCGYDEQVLLSS
ncbi:hypothetical protein PENTCL1PPCAC_22994, partial [Pristionchus entomophagus]